MDFLRDLDFTRAFACTVAGAAVGLELHALDGQRPDTERIAESSGDNFKVVNPFGVGLLVDAVDRSDAAAFEVPSDTFISREHEFFNETVRDITLGASDALHQSVLVEFDDRFGQIKVDGAAALAFAVEDEGEVAHHLERAHQGGVAPAQPNVAIQDSAYIRVSHAFCGANDAF